MLFPFLPVSVAFGEENFFVVTFPDDFRLWESVRLAQQSRRLTLGDSHIGLHHVQDDWWSGDLQVDFFGHVLFQTEVNLAFVASGVGGAEV